MKTVTPFDYGDDTVHTWFGLTYASYLVWTRTLMQEMPEEWQKKFVELAEEYEDTFPGHDTIYHVQPRGEDGRFGSDPLARYRHPDRQAIEEAKTR